MQAGQKATGLTAQLLAYGRRAARTPQSLDMNAIVLNLEQTLRATLTPNLTLTLRLDAQAWPALADRAQIEHVILNLIGNAREAMPDGGSIEIVTSNYRALDATAELASGDYVRLQVIDNGPGMTEEVRERIFEPFFTTKVRGHGLGLASVEGIVYQSGGAIQVRSAPGKGTCFDLLLPRARERKGAEEQSRARPSSA